MPKRQPDVVASRLGNRHFDKLVAAGHPVGEVIAINRFLVHVSGLQPCAIHSLVMFEDGSKGFVHHINETYVVVLHMGSTPVSVGTIAVVQYHELVCKVGKDFLGRIVSVTGEPLDGKGPIATDSVWPVFNAAPPLYERKLLSEQLESGIFTIDSLVPIVRGQRMALLGESKSGKSTLVTQLTINQKNTDQVVVYVLIAKRRSDIETLIDRLTATDSLKKAVIVVATMFESIISNYLVPYVGCSIAEYFWQKCGLDTIVIYDDLTSHAYSYREIALLSGVSPGRDSYPGDMFFMHSSLLERAGRLKSTGKHLTSIPVVNVMGGDITAFLPTNVMSITDGQWVLDMNIFRDGIRPAINMGLSVTRAGGAGHNQRQKLLASNTQKLLAEYRRASEYSRFGTELADEVRRALIVGNQIFEIASQLPTETYSLLDQQLMLDTILSIDNPKSLDLAALKVRTPEYASMISKDEDFDTIKDELMARVSATGASMRQPIVQPNNIINVNMTEKDKKAQSTTKAKGSK